LTRLEFCIVDGSHSFLLVEFQDPQQQNSYHNKRRKRANDAALGFAVAGILLMILVTELSHAGIVHRHKLPSYLMKMIVTASTVALLIFLGIYHHSFLLVEFQDPQQQNSYHNKYHEINIQTSCMELWYIIITNSAKNVNML
jgi:hypothetical protein